MVITQVAEPSGMANDIRRQNLRSLMLFLLSCGEMTKLDLLRRSGLSNTTVSESINNLLALGVVRKAGTQKSTGGRQPTVYSINNNFGSFLGIQIEQRIIKITGTDMQARPMYRKMVVLSEERSLLHTLCGAIEEARDTIAAATLALALGFPGRLDVRHGIVLTSEISNWRNVPIKEILERRFNILTVVDSKVNQGTLYQQVLGIAQHIENFICYFTEAPEQAALVMEGRLCRGDENACCVSLGDSAPIARLASLATMLSLHAVVTDVRDAEFCVRTIPIGLPDDFFEMAAALTAEVSWFEHIYTMQLRDRRKKEGEAK